MIEVTQNNLYKYRLHELWILNFGEKGPEMKRLFVEENPPLHLQTLYLDFNYKKTDCYLIPAERLKKYALFLNTEVEALRNYLSMAA